MRTLTLFRHAKSSWAEPGLPDFDRPLAPRGEDAAPLMAAFLVERGLAPDLVLCSSARRTRETLDLALPAFRPAPKIAYDETLYHAPAPVMIGQIRQTPDEVRNLMILGHNPGLQALAIDLVGAGDTGAAPRGCAQIPDRRRSRSSASMCRTGPASSRAAAPSSTSSRRSG